MNYLALLKWLVNRPVYLKKELYGLFDRLIYQKQSLFLLHNWNAHRCPYQAILFYNFFGRVIFGMKEFIALVSQEKLFKKSIKLDGFDSDIELTRIEGAHDRLWPQSPFVDKQDGCVSDGYFVKIQNALKYTYLHYHDSLDKTKDWERVCETFRTLILDKEGNLNKDAVMDFRKNHSFEQIIADTFKQVDTTSSYTEAYLKGIDLVLEYHRVAMKVKKEILASLSESYAGGSTCVHYRGHRLSEKLLFYAIATDDIIENITFDKKQRNVIMDIGTGYGALPAILKRYIPNACYILTDLPEVIVFTAYYIKYHFPDKKIALINDIDDRLDHFDALVLEYDFIILPSIMTDKIPSETVDLVTNTASLGFLSEEYLSYYVKHIHRILKSSGYFYSINKTHTCEWGIGMYAWQLKEQYVTRVLEYNNRFAYPQWLGQKID